MKKKSLSIYLVIVVLIFALILYLTLKDNFYSILNIIKNVNLFFLIVGILFVFLSKYLIAKITYLLAEKEQDNVNMSKLLQICLIYPFFAGITPGSVGGESFEIFYLKQTGLSYGKSSNIVLQKFIVYEIATMAVNALAILLNLFTKIVAVNSFIIVAIIINFVVNGIGLGFFYLLGYNEKFNNFIMKKGLAILGKLKIIKNIDEMREKLDNYLEGFNEGVEKLKNDKKTFRRLVFLYILSQIFFYLAILPLAFAMNIRGINVINLFILVAFVRIVSLLIVTPGNSGAAEYCFVYLFTGLLDDANIMTFMLLWRLVIYYIPLIVGGITAIAWGRREKCEKINSV